MNPDLPVPYALTMKEYAALPVTDSGCLTCPGLPFCSVPHGGSGCLVPDGNQEETVQEAGS